MGLIWRICHCRRLGGLWRGHRNHVSNVGEQHYYRLKADGIAVDEKSICIPKNDSVLADEIWIWAWHGMGNLWQFGEQILVSRYTVWFWLVKRGVVGI